MKRYLFDALVVVATAGVLYAGYTQVYARVVQHDAMYQYLLRQAQAPAPAPAAAPAPEKGK